MYPPELTLYHARSRLQNARDHARTMRLHPRLRVRLSRTLYRFAERPLPGVAAWYAAALPHREV